MCRGSRCGAALLILSVTLLAACRMSFPPTALPTGEVSPTKPLPPSIASPFTPTSSCPPSGSISVSLATPQPADVLLELAWEGGFTRPELAFALGRVPEFSLLPDGHAYYIDALEGGEAQMMVAHLTPAERQELVQRVLDLGIERLESYTDQCQPQADGSCLCVADAGESVVRVRLPGGELREIRNYYVFANEPGVLEAIRVLLQDYRHLEAEAYEPDKAAFFIQLVSPPSDMPVRDWPLHPAWLTGGRPDYPCARTLSGSDLQALLAVTGRNMGDCYFRDADAGQVYSVYLVPWLPGVDYTDLIASSDQACPPAEALTPEPEVTSTTIISDALRHDAEQRVLDFRALGQVAD